ncbi:SH3 domain-containing protein [uncultured Flavobacterium sp.]|uniref:SH3 domain-containing protein n=1 Tax=uncultured Flavobacterium sp. TaxID=165435 RepID=UPI0030C820E9
MKSIKSSTILFFLLIISNSFSQDRFWILNDTRLFEKPSETSTFYGYFKRGAEIKIISEINSNWSKIQSDNMTIGYVLKKYISNSLNYYDVYTNDIENPILNGGDKYYGGNHLFVNVAGLKGRALTDKNSTVKRILTNGEAVQISYYPINEEQWVNIGYGFDSNAVYVQRKYIGQRPNFEDLINQFDTIEVLKVEERKKIAERLVELATNSDNETLKPAFERYLLVANQLNDIKKIEETEFNLFIVSKINFEYNFEEVNNFAKNSEFIINGKKSQNCILPLNFIIKTLGKPLKKETVTDECGVYLSELFYKYENITLSVDEKENKTELIDVIINNINKFSFNLNDILDNNTTEKEFIIKYSKYITTNFKNPNIYLIHLESSSIIFEFKIGVLSKVSVNNYC